MPRTFVIGENLYYLHNFWHPSSQLPFNFHPPPPPFSLIAEFTVFDTRKPFLCRFVCWFVLLKILPPQDILHFPRLVCIHKHKVSFSASITMSHFLYVTFCMSPYSQMLRSPLLLLASISISHTKIKQNSNSQIASTYLQAECPKYINTLSIICVCMTADNILPSIIQVIQCSPIFIPGVP